MKTVEEIQPYTCLLDEFMYIAKEMKKAKQFIQEKQLENLELKRDAKDIATELYISQKCHHEGFYGNAKHLMKFLLQNESKEMIDLKFPILVQLIEIYGKINSMVQEIKEEEGET